MGICSTLLPGCGSCGGRDGEPERGRKEGKESGRGPEETRETRRLRAHLVASPYSLLLQLARPAGGGRRANALEFLGVESQREKDDLNLNRCSFLRESSFSYNQRAEP